MAGDSQFLFIKRLDATLKTTAGQSGDNILGVSKYDTFMTGKTAKVYFKDGEEPRIGVKIEHNKKCTNCGICTENCPMGAIENGIIGKNCIRCLRCVTGCPENALEFKTLWFMKAYLLPGRKNEIKYYL